MTVLIYSTDGESSRLQVQELDPRWSPHPCLLPACGLGQHRHDPSQPVLGSSASQWMVTTVPPLEVCCDDYKGALVKPSSQCPASVHGASWPLLPRELHSTPSCARGSPPSLLFSNVYCFIYTHSTL